MYDNSNKSGKSGIKWDMFLMPALYVIVGILLGMLIRGLFIPKPDIICKSLNLTYTVDDRDVTLKDGRCLLPVTPDGKDTMLAGVNYLPLRGELSGDARDDAAVILMMKTPDGYLSQYVAAAIGTPRGARGTNAVSIGEDCTVLNLTVEDGIIWVTLEEGANSVETDRQFVYRDGQLIEIG